MRDSGDDDARFLGRGENGGCLMSEGLIKGGEMAEDGSFSEEPFTFWINLERFKLLMEKIFIFFAGCFNEGEEEDISRGGA